MKIEMIKTYIEKNMSWYDYLFDGSVKVIWNNPKISGNVVIIEALYDDYYMDTVEIELLDLLTFIFEISINQ